MTGLLRTVDVAELLAVGEEFVRDHAAELGGVRLSGPRSPLRFTDAGVEAFIEKRRLHSAEPVDTPARPGPKRRAAGVELLPLPEGA